MSTPDKRMVIPPPISGLNTRDITTAMDLTYSPNMKNVYVESSHVQSRLGYSRMGQNLPLPGNGMDLVEFVDGSGDTHLIALTTSCAAEYDAANDTWDNISPLKENLNDDAVVDDCEASWVATDAAISTVTHDTGTKIEGAKSVKVAVAADVAEGAILARVDKTAFNVAGYSQIRFKVYPVASNITAGHLGLRLSEKIYSGNALINTRDLIGQTHVTAYYDTGYVQGSAGVGDIVSIPSISFTGPIESILAIGATATTFVVTGTASSTGTKAIIISRSASSTENQQVVNAAALTAGEWNTVIANLDLFSDKEFDRLELIALNATGLDGKTFYVDDIQLQNPFNLLVTHRWAHTRATNSVTFGGSKTALVITSDLEGPYEYDGSTGAIFEALTLSSDFTSFGSTRELIEFWNHLFCLDYTDNGVRYATHLVFHSVDFPEVAYASKSLTEVLLTDTKGKILRALKLGYDMIIYNDLSLTVCQRVGGAQLFLFPTFIYETGLLGPRAVHSLVNGHVFVGTDQKIYSYSGATQLNDIGRNIDISFFNDLDISQRSYINVVQNQQLKKLFIFYPNTGRSYPHKYFALNYDNNQPLWEAGEFAHSAMGMSTFRNAVSLRCDSVYFTDTTRDECDDTSLDAFRCWSGTTTEGFPQAVFVDIDGYVYRFDESSTYDDGEAIEAFFETADITVDRGRTDEYVRWGEFAFNGKTTIDGSVINVYYSTDDGESWTQLTDDSARTDIPLSLNDYEQHRCPMDVLSRKIRFKLSQTTSGDFYVRELSVTRDLHVNR